MWAVRNDTPFAADACWGRDHDGGHEWIVAVRASYDIAGDRTLAPSERQQPPLLMPRYRGEDGKSSLLYECDLCSLKPVTDVTVNGTAYAPGGRAREDFPVGIRIDRVHKELHVYGDRTWRRTAAGLEPGSPAPFVHMPIVYERAFGGMSLYGEDSSQWRLDTRNPVGCGLVPEPGGLVPNIAYPGKGPTEAGPAGFGALASFWSPRRELGGTYDERWEKDRYPLLPADWRAESLQCSPPDQRPARHLVGGEAVELMNLTPEGILRFALPRLDLVFHTRFATRHGQRRVDHGGHVSSVIVEPDERRLTMVVVSVLACGSDVDSLDETTVRVAGR